MYVSHSLTALNVPVADVRSHIVEEFSQREEEKQRRLAALAHIGFASVVQTLVAIQLKHQRNCFR